MMHKADNDALLQVEVVGLKLNLSTFLKRFLFKMSGDEEMYKM